MYKGIDVSSIQGNVDYKNVKESGISFVIAKCACGNEKPDHTYELNRKGSKDNGLLFAAYHFVFPLPSDSSHPGRSPQEQAQAHFALADGELAACDIEWPYPQDWHKWGCSATQINDWVLSYLKEYERLSGKKMLVYTDPDFANNVKFTDDFAEYPLWLANYNKNIIVPSPWKDWVMWQTTGGGGVLSNGQKVDTNVAKDLSFWDIAVTPVPTVDPLADTIDNDYHSL